MGCEGVHARVARWFVFKPKISIWVNFGGPYIDWKMLIYFLATVFGIVYRHLGYFITILYILCSFGTFYRFWVSFTKKNLATQVQAGPEQLIFRADTFPRRKVLLKVLLKAFLKASRLRPHIFVTNISMMHGHDSDEDDFADVRASRRRIQRDQIVL
jgi:hypothetical protein